MTGHDDLSSEENGERQWMEWDDKKSFKKINNEGMEMISMGLKAEPKEPDEMEAEWEVLDQAY